ncbi:MAG: NADH-quinone oxidoreductase subunit NuoE family protein [Propionibacteriaceae bacterium]
MSSPLLATVSIENADLVAMVDALVTRHGATRGALLPILQDLLAERGEISTLAMQLVADRLGASPAEVQGVVTFYSFLGEAARGRHVIRLCRTLSCMMAGTRDVAAAFEAELGIPFGATTPDGVFTLEWTNCIGMCCAPPALLADAEAFSSVSPAQVGEVIGALRASGVQE